MKAYIKVKKDYNSGLAVGHSQNMKKAISDMQKDQVLQEYQYFVGGSRNGGSRVMTQDEDGMVVRLG